MFSKLPKTKDAVTKAADLRSRHQAFRRHPLLYGTLSGYRKPSEAKASQNMIDRSFPAQNVNVGFAQGKTIQGTGRRRASNPSPGSPVCRIDCTYCSQETGRMDVRNPSKSPRQKYRIKAASLRSRHLFHVDVLHNSNSGFCQHLEMHR